MPATAPPTTTPPADTAVDFRGVGQEPGWLLEIAEGYQIAFLADYGTRRFVFAAPAPQPEAAGGRIYRTGDGTHTLEVRVENRPCADAMSGAPYPNTVTVRLDGQDYRGCGEPLAG